MSALIRPWVWVLGVTFVVIGCKPVPGTDGESSVKLIGGTVAKKGQFPCAVGYNCTYCRIKPKWLLTAAHCVKGNVISSGKSIKFVYGVRRNHSFKATVAQSYVHPEYQKRFDTVYGKSAYKIDHAAHDVGLIRLVDEPPADVGIAALSNQRVRKGTRITVAGYGCRKHPHALSGLFGAGLTDLRFARGRITSFAEATAMVHSDDGKSATCPGDSGGAAFTSDGKIIGVNSTRYSDVKGLSGIAAFSRNGMRRWMDRILSGTYDDSKVKARQNKSSGGSTFLP